MAAVVAADPDEATVEVAAVEELVDNLGDDGAQGAEAVLELFCRSHAQSNRSFR